MEEIVSSNLKENGTLNDGKDELKEEPIRNPLNGNIIISTGETEVLNETTLPYLPSDNFEVSTVPTENKVAQGLVIVEKTTKDEYVWIEVPKTDTVYQTAGLNITDFSNINLRKIRDDLHNYTKVFRKDNSGETLNEGIETKCKDWWYDELYDSSIQARRCLNQEDPLADSTELSEYILSNKDGCGLTYTEYQTNYKVMLQSIYQNGGFYITRYEIGILGTDDISVYTGRNSSSDRIYYTDTSTRAISKKDAIPYNYLYCSDAQTLINNMPSGNCISSLLFGVQWDLVLKFLQERGNLTLEQLKGRITGSTEWGNFGDSEDFEIDRGKYTVYRTSNGYQDTWVNYKTNTENYVSYLSGNTSIKKKIKYGESDSGWTLLTTGSAAYRNMKLNICDFAGNIEEYTLEYSSSVDVPCVTRGSSFIGSIIYPASCRLGTSSNGSDYWTGARGTIY